MRRYRLVLAAFGMAFWLPIMAAVLNVQVLDDHGKPVGDAVVSMVARTVTAGDPPALPAAQTKTVDQRRETFLPYVEIFRPGDSVVFRNSDTTRHHVYSFSPTRNFEMVVRPGQSTEPMLLDRAGIVAVGCNIHDHMRNWLFVSSAPWLAIVDAGGHVRFDALPVGKYTVTVWHPQLDPRKPPIAHELDIVPGQADADMLVTLSLLPDPRMPMDHNLMQY